MAVMNQGSAKGWSWDTPVEADPQWVKQMTCALNGHQWEDPKSAWNYARKVCSRCGMQLLRSHDG